MKFITEADLRAMYRKAPFTTYEPEPDTRLTPGARQFLNDRNIRFKEEQPSPGKWGVVYAKAAETSSSKAVGQTAAETSDTDGNAGQMSEGEPMTGRKPEISPEKKALFCRLNSVQALFLEAGAEFMGRDVLLAQKVFGLERHLARLKDAEDRTDIPCQSCTGICKDNYSEEMEDCFEITSFHAQSERGKDVIRLHRLRCLLRELAPQVKEVLGDDKNKQLHQTINSLSQLICLVFGGKTCQKKE